MLAWWEAAATARYTLTDTTLTDFLESERIARLNGWGQ